MAIGRTFAESFQKAIRGTEVKRFGYGLDRNDKWLMALRALGSQQMVLGPYDAEPDVMIPPASAEGDAEALPEGSTSPPGLPELRTADGELVEWPIPEDKLSRKLAVPGQARIFFIRYAFKLGWDLDKVARLTKIDPWFLDQMKVLVEFEETLFEHNELEEVPRDVMLRAKQLGYSDAQLANVYLGTINADTVLKVREHRKALGIEPAYKLVDTCAAEFAAVTPYYYSTYETPVMVDGRAEVDDEARVTGRPKVIIIGGGPNRIGQGIEFDYCCCHAAFAARDLGLESVMINSNPETVSTDYDTSDLLFFEPLTLEDVVNVIERLNGRALGAAGGLVRGVICQFGGQTPLNLAKGLAKAKVPIIGTTVDSIDLAEDRDRFDAMLTRLGLQKPPSGIARTLDEAWAIAKRIGYPVLVRPSYVLGGRGMEICSDEKALASFVTSAAIISELDDAPVLIDRFLSDATEVDVDVVADFAPAGEERSGGRAVVCSVMEHVEQAGIHSGDSSCIIPPWSLEPELVERIKEIARTLARELRVNGLMNLQLAIKRDQNGQDQVFILEVNPRASRTVPFVGKAVGVQWPRIAAKVMMGRGLDEQGVREVTEHAAAAVKVSVFPFAKFPGVDVVLGPEMRSTGEVMGMDRAWPIAFAKGLMGAGIVLPTEGMVFVSVRSADRHGVIEIAHGLADMGFSICATEGTAKFLRQTGIEPKVIQKIDAGARPNVVDLMSDGKIQLVINTPTRTGWQTDEGKIRAAAVRLGIPMITTLTGAMAAVRAIRALRKSDWTVAALQDYHRPAAKVGGAESAERGGRLAEARG
ncbi:MAG: carbamoyl-phosphate synthase large subunit [Phycisphaeraceae bacterium]|nr:carbamoyl-phosphate synthase large subunit [Phycisphaeraceae bacterium]